MGIAGLISRITAYYTRHGFRATISRAGLAMRRVIFSNRMIVFYCELDDQITAPAIVPSFLKVEHLRSYVELNPQDLQEMSDFWNPKLARRNIRERFEKGASLWLIKSKGVLAGYSWTIRGRTIAAYYFPVAQDDVQLFDFYVFPKFRGRAILWFLVTDILQNLKSEGVSRVFGDVAEWNQPSLSFYKTTPFRCLGLARSFTVFGHGFTSWITNETFCQVPKSGRLTDRIPTITRGS
jgi:ribosomal protein S18 acetylase RimI-like enzyme